MPALLSALVTAIWATIEPRLPSAKPPKRCGDFCEAVLRHPPFGRPWDCAARLRPRSESNTNSTPPRRRGRAGSLSFVSNLHSDWQGTDIWANEGANFVAYSDKRPLYENGRGDVRAHLRHGLRQFAVDTPEDAFDRTPAPGVATCNWLAPRSPTDDEAL